MLCLDDAGTGDGTLRAVSAAVEPGTVALLTGPDDGARQRLLQLLAGHARPRQGRVTLDTLELDHWAPHELARRCALQQHGQCMAFGCNALDVMLFGRCSRHGDRASPAACMAGMDALAALDLLELADRPWCTLCPEAQYRVQLARSLARLWQDGTLEGRYLLLDEPFVGLPKDAARRLWVQLLRLAAQGLAMVLNVGDLRPAACRRVQCWQLEAGRLEAVSGT